MDIFEYLKRLHDECIKHSERIVFDKKHPRLLHLVGLYGSLIELTGSLITLIDRKHRTGIPPIFRSVLEAYVEFKNLHNDAKYGYYMDASYHEQWLKVLKEAKNKPNPFLQAISEFDNLDEQIKEHEAELEDLNNKGYKSLSIFNRFERAGMVDEYRSLYNFLSNDAHSNIRALVNRHLEIHENDFTVVYYKDEPLEDYLPTLDLTAGLLVDASLKIHQFFETGAYSEIEKSSKELNEIRNKY